MLNKYILDSSKVLPFITESLIDVNNLSDILLKAIDFDAGVFFTLVPEGSNLDRLYEFEAGLVLPQNPIMRTLTKDGKWSRYSFVPTVEVELSKLLLNILVKNELVCIFDDILHSPNGKDFFQSIREYRYINDNQLYYILNRDDLSCDNIQLCLKKSGAFWHSLCIISKSNIDLNDQCITNKDFEDICSQAELVFVGAYDGEGYVFWERNGSDLFGQYVQSHSETT